MQMQGGCGLIRILSKYMFTSRAYDPADYDHVPDSAEIKELFQYITRWVKGLTVAAEYFQLC